MESRYKSMMLLGMILIWPAGLLGQSVESVKILEISPTKKTFKINRGSLEGLAEGEKANFYNKNSNDDTFKQINVAEAIKVFGDYSIWMVKEVVGTGELAKDRRAYFLRKGEVLKGRRQFKISRKKVVFADAEASEIVENVDSYLEEYDRGFPKDLIKFEDQFEANSGELTVTEMPSNSEGELLQVSGWEQVDNQESDLDDLLDDESKVFNAPGGITEFDYNPDYTPKLKQKVVSKKSRNDELLEILDVENQTEGRSSEQYIASESFTEGNPEDIADELFEEEFESVAEGLIDKANDPNFDPQLDAELDLLTNGEKNRFLRMKKVSQSTYMKNRNYKLKKELSTEAINKIEEQGDLWSADMSDQQLRRFIVNNGLAKEKERQGFFKENSIDHEVQVKFTVNASDNATLEDDKNRGIGTSFNLGYELHLSRFSFDYKAWALEVDYRKGLNSYDVGDINALSNESSFGFYGKYYFKSLPTEINKYLFYVGGGFRLGSTVLSSETNLQDEYEYSYASIPTLMGGIKYRWKKNLGPTIFRTGLGFFANLIFESTTLSNNDLENNELDEELSYNNLKVEFGLSIYF